MKSAAATWSRGLYRPIRAFCHWGRHILLLLILFLIHGFLVTPKRTFLDVRENIQIR